MLIGSALAIFAWEFWSLAFALVIAGLGIAPALAVMFSIVSASVKFSDTAEAYGWVGTGQLIGAALGSAIAGFLIDEFGPEGAFWPPPGSRSSPSRSPVSSVAPSRPPLRDPSPSPTCRGADPATSSRLSRCEV